jgi:microcin C transport system permease protein
MTAYIIRRLLLIVPTLIGAMLINFLIVQAAPGGPVHQVISQVTGHGVAATQRVTQAGGELQGSQGGGGGSGVDVRGDYRGAQGLDPEFIENLEKQFGFDKPAHERFLLMLGNYATFDFGESFFRSRSVTDLILDKLPVSISLGLWTTVLTYLISIPLGIAKATRDGTRFDFWTSVVVLVGNAIPAFLFAVFLIVIFAGGAYLDWFPLRGIVSDDWETLSWPMRIVDYFWHMALPLTALVIGSFASLTMLTKNSFLDQIGQQYVVTARAKGLSQGRVLYGHVFRNAMLIVIAGFPVAFVNILFTGAVLIEILFSLDGLGLLGFEAVVNRDYPVMFGTLFIFTLMGLVLQLINDIMYTVVDPRIDFEARAG